MMRQIWRRINKAAWAVYNKAALKGWLGYQAWYNVTESMITDRDYDQMKAEAMERNAETAFYAMGYDRE